MERKKLYNPGDMISTFTGQMGIVISKAEYLTVKEHIKEGRRPGHFFAPGCCANPDYVTQIPALFDDGTYDVMRSMNIKKAPNTSKEKKETLKKMIENLTK